MAASSTASPGGGLAAGGVLLKTDAPGVGPPSGAAAVPAGGAVAVGGPVAAAPASGSTGAVSSGGAGAGGPGAGISSSATAPSSATPPSSAASDPGASGGATAPASTVGDAPPPASQGAASAAGVDGNAWQTYSEPTREAIVQEWMNDNPSACPGGSATDLVLGVTDDYGSYYPMDASVAAALTKLCSQH